MGIGLEVLSRAALLVSLALVPGRAPTAEDTARAVHLLQRATHGVRAADLAVVLAAGPAAWLERQLHPERIDEAVLGRRLARYPAAVMGIAELYRTYSPRRPGRSARVPRDSLSPAARRGSAMRSPQRIVAELIGAKVERAVFAERQLEEVMTDFWFNHFNVFFGKGPVRWLVADYERTAIRPHVFGRFEEMLIATASHPAMLVYLDNWSSTAPDSTAGAESRPGRRRGGLNENYARELLELHTIGVDGGYTQRDVVEVARAFTGWTITRPGAGDAEGIASVFRPRLHDAGEKVVLGHRLAPGRGREDGLDVLRLLARHPATARQVARKLAERFVADEPPAELVDRLTTVFLETGGDLREVTRALFTADAFFDPAYRRVKVKRPFELVASALRATGTEPPAPRVLMQTLRTFGHLPYLEQAPTGYPARKEEWVNSGAMLDRMNFGLTLAADRVRSARSAEPEWLARAVGAGELAELVGLLAGRVLPGVATAELEAVVLADLGAQSDADPGRVATRALGLILGSPEFQHH